MPVYTILLTPPNYANPPAASPNWISATQPYIKSWQVFLCPSAFPANNAPPLDVYNPILTPNPSNTNYRVNGVLLQRRISAMQNTAGLIWLQDVVASSSHAFARPTNSTNYNALPIQATDNLSDWNEPGYILTHFNGGNLLFADGHVKWRKQDGISAREFGLNSDVKGEQTGSVTAQIDTAQVGAS